MDYFEKCRECGEEMVRISSVDTSPLIVECKVCSHREYAEVNIAPPWPPVEDDDLPVEDEYKQEKGFSKYLRKSTEDYDSSGTPVSIGIPGEKVKVIPFGWILLSLIGISIVVFILVLLCC